MGDFHPQNPNYLPHFEIHFFEKTNISLYYSMCIKLQLNVKKLKKIRTKNQKILIFQKDFALINLFTVSTVCFQNANLFSSCLQSQMIYLFNAKCNRIQFLFISFNISFCCIRVLNYDTAYAIRPLSPAIYLLVVLINVICPYVRKEMIFTLYYLLSAYVKFP